MLPLKIKNENELDSILTEPKSELIDAMSRLDGDIMILGIGGKMGTSLGVMAVRALTAGNIRKKVYGVSRFSDAAGQNYLERSGIKTIACDLLNQSEVEKLPRVKNIIFMAGKKFGTQVAADYTWVMNTLAPGYIAEHFSGSNIVVFSTGCVYPLVGVETGGCSEDICPEPVGDYAQSALGRERVFGYYARSGRIRALIFRLNYATDLRYGILYDIGAKVWSGQVVNRNVGYLNVIWQGTANYYALRSLELCSSPAEILNITGPEMVSVEHVAESFGKLMNKKVYYEGEVGNRCYLNNASKSFEFFGHPPVNLELLLQWQASWIMDGGRSLDKPTHFEVSNGKF